jgi:hypothetical protein
MRDKLSAQESDGRPMPSIDFWKKFGLEDALGGLGNESSNN